jgi:hypothetical protein
MPTFEEGQTVEVRHVHKSIVNGVVTGEFPQAPFTGTIERYWRSGQWVVREPAGTTCAYPESEIRPV